ncbi:MAG: ABC transporter ATP-binding protein [Lachnospiraceae bacterium]|nr:ABC transporter ATP-binding protein [Lachnospiraceae bacterium]
MKKLLVFMKHYKKETVLAPLFKMLEASFELLVPLVMAAIVDTGIRNADIPYIIKMGLVLVALALIGLATAATAQYFSARAAVGFAAELKHALFAHIQSMNYAETDKTGTSTLITRLTSDINQVQSGVNLVLRLFLRSPIVVFGAMIMAFTIDVKAALVFVVTIPALSVVVFGIMLVSIPLYKKVQAALDKVLGITRENLSGVRVIRAFSREEEEREMFAGYNMALMDIQNFVGKISALMNPVTYIIVNAATIVLIYTGAVQVDENILTQGEVIALVNYMSQILVELVKLANLIITVTKAVACGNRIQGIFDQPAGMKVYTEEKKEKETGWNADRVVFEHANLCYPGAGADSLTDIHLAVKKGETVGIIGGTGSGKSSLVQMIPRFYDATAGRVLVDGKDVKAYEPGKLKEKIGIVPQKAVLFRGSIRENICWGKENASEEEIWKALSAAQAKEFVEEKEGQLEFEILQGGKNLSGGQKQRLTIARALVKQPEILILDDSASALDYATDAALRKSIRELDPEMTVFIVSQRTASVLHADKIVVLEDGEVAGIGTHGELLETCPVYKEIHESQAHRESAGKQETVTAQTALGKQKGGN